MYETEFTILYWWWPLNTGRCCDSIVGVVIDFPTISPTEGWSAEDLVFYHNILCVSFSVVLLDYSEVSSIIPSVN